MATFTLNSRIKIGNYKPFRGVHEVVIKKSLNNYNDTAVVKLPASVVMKEKNTAPAQRVQTAMQFKRGDKIAIELGYNEVYNLEFEGFISRVNKTVPCELECEGFAFQLRGKQINKVYRNASLSAILSDLTEGTDIVLSNNNDDVTIDKIDFIRFSRFTALQALSKDLAEAVRFWFDGNVLHAGMKYLFFTEKNKNWKPDVVYKTGYNHVREGHLKERLAGDNNYEVQLNVRSEDGKTKTVKAGVVNSNVERKRLSAVSDSALLKRLAKELESEKNYTGVEGNITGFLFPICKPGMKLKLIDERYEELSGNYLVEEVEVKYGRSGARRKIKLSFKL